MARIRIPLINVTLHWGSKDGGPESRVYMYGIEAKWAASVLVLRFEDGSRDAYHSHAFTTRSIVLGPGMLEELHHNGPVEYHEPLDVVSTPRECCHKVVSLGRAYVLSLRGPWQENWTDIDGPTGVATVLRSGRVAVPS